jgi:S-layer family protein
VPSDHIFYEWIGRLAARGVTVGCASGIFCPNSAVLQQEMSAFVIRALGMPAPPDPPSQRFTDVPPSQTFYKFIEQMGARGIWNGRGGRNYCPLNPVLRDEMAAIVIRGRGEFNPPTPATQRFTDVPPTNQYYNFVDRMAVLGITSGCPSP